ncbi:hypothetical protein CsSME_00030288 [Camellia sinensis var. sinensis]
MHHAFSMMELGNISYFLGVSVQHTSKGFFLSQHKYAFELLVNARMVDCKPCAKLVSAKVRTTIADSFPCPQPFLYRSIVRAL